MRKLLLGLTILLSIPYVHSWQSMRQQRRFGIFTQSNFAKHYQLEYDIRALQQKNMNIQEFYSAMTDLWDQLALTESTELKACGAYIERREQQRLV